MAIKYVKKTHDDWETPQEILDMVKNDYFEGHNFFDPCPLKAKFDGLKMSWKKRNFVNPPYNPKLKEAFIIKAFYEMLKGKHVVMLLPVFTSTNIFHSIILPYANIRFIYKRIKFKGINSYGKYVTDVASAVDSMLVEFKIEESL